MKILHVLTQLPAKTGSGVYFSNLIDSFNKLGVESAALYGTENIHTTNINASFVEEVIYDTDDLPFHICGMSDVMPYKSTVYKDMSPEEKDLLLNIFKKKLEKIKKEFNPDIVISHHLFIVTDLVKRVFSDKLVIGICHGTDIRQIKQKTEFLKKLRNIKYLDEVFTVTHDHDKSIIELLDVPKERIHFIGGGYNKDVFYPAKEKIKKDKIRIMYAGKISDSKGVFELASCLNILEKSFNNIEVHIVGNASEEDVRRLRNNSNNSENLFIYNTETQAEMADCLREADIFVLPSYYEALGLVAIEALACEKLVVCSEIDGLRALLGKDLIDSGIIEFTSLPQLHEVDKPFEEEIPAYVERLAKNISLQISRLDKDLFTENISREIDSFAWENIGKKIFQLINQIN